MFRIVITFAIIIIALILLFRLSAYSLMSGNFRAEIILATVAIVFLFIGLYINRRTQRKLQPATTSIDHQKIADLGISKREYEVL